MRTNILHLTLALAAVAGAAAGNAAQTVTTAERGSGKYPAVFEQHATLPNHIVYRPQQLQSLGKRKLPVYVWGNGGCSADGTSSKNHLLEIASHGYLAIAAGTLPAPKHEQDAAPQQTPPGQLQARTATSLLTDAIDWAIRENDRRGSPYFGRINRNRIAVSGWSCGGLQALNVADDPRVKTAVIMYSGFFKDGPSPIGGVDSNKSTLAKLHTPVLYVLGGKDDIAHDNGMDDFSRINHVPAAVINIPVGHGGTFEEPHGGLAATLVTSWLDWQLKGDKAAARRFKSAKCGYCNDSRFSIERKKLD